MTSTERDFYEGFEGEPELQFVAADATGGAVDTVRMWIGHFQAIVDKLNPGPYGWTGIALPYHTHTGWYEEDSWRVPDLDELGAQWNGIAPSSLGATEKEAHRAVADLIDAARSRGATVSR